jgi:hypothetical protein
MSDPGFAPLGPSLLARKGGAKPAMRPQVAPLVADEAEIAALAKDQLEDLGWNDMGGREAEPDPEAQVDPGGGADIVPINADVAAGRIADDTGPIVRRQQRRLEARVLADAAMSGPENREPDYAEEDDGAETGGYDLPLADAHAEAYDADDYGAESSGEEEEEADANENAYASLAPRPVLSPAPAPAPVPAPAQRRMRVPATPAGRRAAFTLRLDADRHLKLRLAATMQGASAQALVTEALDRLLAEFEDLDVIANHLKRH